MTYLVLAVAVWVAMGSLLKVGELYGQDRLVVMACNYVFAALVAACAWALLGTGVPGTVTLVLGPVGGFFWAAGLFLWMGAIGSAGLGTSTAAIRMSVLWPTLLSLLAFGEVPGAPNLLGVGLTFAVLGLLAAHSLRAGRVLPGSGGFRWLAATFVLNGGVGVTQKLFTEWAPPAEKMALLTLVYLTAALMCGAELLRRRPPLRREDLLRGMAFGLGNVTGNTLLLLGLEHVPGSLAFPFTSVAVILSTALVGALVWRERPGPLGGTAIALAAVSIALMSL